MKAVWSFHIYIVQITHKFILKSKHPDQGKKMSKKWPPQVFTN